jgi:hypothetical protein
MSFRKETKHKEKQEKGKDNKRQTGKKQQNKFMLYLRARSFNHQLQLLVKISVKGVYLFYTFLTANITC